MTMTRWPLELASLVEVARQAGDRIMAHYATGTEVRYKADESPVTAADLAAHGVIASALGERTPSIPLLSEEGEPWSWAQRRQWTRYWLVDPLDGTREFIAGNGEFTVNIALIQHGEPVMGVVHAPALSETYAAARGEGAWRFEAGEPPTRLAVTAVLPRRPRVLVTRSHAKPALATLLNRLPPHESIGVGSALKFGRLAAGAGEFYPRIGPTCEWDTAAGHCVVEAAGATLQVAGGGALRYNQCESLLNPDFSVAAAVCSAWHDYLS